MSGDSARHVPPEGPTVDFRLVKNIHKPQRMQSVEKRVGCERIGRVSINTGITVFQAYSNISPGFSNLSNQSPVQTPYWPHNALRTNLSVPIHCR
eukprot:1209509-Amorphochlora_amoeboformis.AAC.1